MKSVLNNPTCLARVFVCLLCLGLLGAAGVDEYDTLYLRDGSVLKGTIIRQNIGGELGEWLVYSPYGELKVNPVEVIHMTRHEALAPVVDEMHIFLGNQSESIAIIVQDVPERRGGAETFTLLLPGVIDSIKTDDDFEIPFKSRVVGENICATINYSAIPKKTKRIRVTLWQTEPLEEVGAGRAKFSRQFTPDSEGLACVTLKFPKEWKPGKISPAAAKQFDGLIIWRQKLDRQQPFAPEVVFEIPKAAAGR